MMVTRFSWILNDCIPLEMLTPTEQANKKNTKREWEKSISKHAKKHSFKYIQLLLSSALNPGKKGQTKTH